MPRIVLRYVLFFLRQSVQAPTEHLIQMLQQFNEGRLPKCILIQPLLGEIAALRDLRAYFLKRASKRPTHQPLKNLWRGMRQASKTQKAAAKT